VLAPFRELLAYRALIQILVARDLKARYRGSILGLLWTLLNPLLHMGIYALLFSVYMRSATERFAVFLLCGLLPWIWLSASLTMGATSIVEGGSLLKKVFFPAHVLPTVTVTANFVNFLLGIPILFTFLVLYGVQMGLPVLLLPFIIVCQFAFTLGLTFMLAAVSVHYRDIPHILGHFLTFWFFLSPIVYPATQVPEAYRFILLLNPFVPFVVAYQDILLYNVYPSPGVWGGMIGISLGVLLCGLCIFTHLRWSFAEEI
jgi:lipopolysaccharide transport system permease protein